MTRKDKTILFVGCGNMGASMIQGLAQAGFPPEQLRAADPDRQCLQRLSRQFGVRATEDVPAACEESDVLVLAVKPSQARDALAPLRESLARRRPLLLSVAAGVTMAQLQEWAGVPLPIVRAMPNTPARVGMGITGLSANEQADTAHQGLAEELLRPIGETLWFPKEEDLDRVTAVSGSGPAYFFLWLELMEQAAVRIGLSQQEARTLVRHTARGAAELALREDVDAGTLREQVTSPGGTTEQALRVLQGAELDTLFTQTLEAARARAQELAQKSEQESGEAPPSGQDI